MSKKLYKPKRKSKKEKITILDRIEITIFSACIIGLSVWAIISVYNLVTAVPVPEYNVYTKCVANYISTLNDAENEKKESILSAMIDQAEDTEETKEPVSHIGEKKSLKASRKNKYAQVK